MLNNLYLQTKNYQELWNYRTLVKESINKILIIIRSTPDRFNSESLHQHRCKMLLDYQTVKTNIDIEIERRVDLIPTEKLYNDLGLCTGNNQ
jgi:hypothetical protein